MFLNGLKPTSVDSLVFVPLSQPVNEEMFLSDFGLSAPEPSQPEATHEPETTVEVCKAAVFVEGMETTKNAA